MAWPLGSMKTNLKRRAAPAQPLEKRVRNGDRRCALRRFSIGICAAFRQLVGGGLMVPFFEARARVLASARLLGRESVPLESALGRVLADPLFADAPIPAFDCSAMDGYAVRCAEVESSGTSVLPVHGTCKAGDAPVEHVAGSAWR